MKCLFQCQLAQPINHFHDMKLLTHSLRALFVVLFSLTAIVHVFPQETDVLTTTSLGIKDQYINFGTVTGKSGAVYRGIAAAWNDSSCIQLINNTKLPNLYPGIIAQFPQAVEDVSITFHVNKGTGNDLGYGARPYSIFVFGDSKSHTDVVKELLSSKLSSYSNQLKRVDAFGDRDTTITVYINQPYKYLVVRVDQCAVYFDSISFAWGQVVKSSPNLRFSKPTAVAYLGGTFTEPQLFNSGGVVPRYSSSDTSVASVDEATGKITPLAEGTTTITASSEENATYLADTASYLLTVEKKPEISQALLFYEPFDKCDAKGGNDGIWYNSPSDQETDVLDSRADSFTNNKGWTFVNVCHAAQCIRIGRTNSNRGPEKLKGIGSATMPAIPQLNGEATLTFRAGLWDTTNEKYQLLLSATGGAKLSQTYFDLRKAKGQFKKFKVTITNATPKTRIKFYGGGSAAPNRIFLDDVKIYGDAPVELDTLTTTTNEGYGTYYAAKAIVMPDSLVGNIITGATPINDQEGKLTIVEKYHPGDVVPAGTALLLKGDPNNTKGKAYSAQLVSDYQGTAPAENLLCGENHIDEQGMTYYPGDNVLYYIFSYNLEGENLGFYWAAPEGGPAKYQSPRAFLALTKQQAAHVKGFAFDAKPTGISPVTTEPQDQKQPTGIYTLTGLRVSAPLSSLPAGVYIVNGKKVLVR